MIRRVVAGLLGCLLLAGCASLGSEHTIIDWADVVHVDGREYLGKYGEAALSASNIGVLVTTVRRKIADSNAGIHHQWVDGDAAFLVPSTKLFEMRGYARRFRLIALVGTEYRYYELSEDRNARTGRDLLDIEGRVISVSRLSDTDGRAVATTTDRVAVSRLVRFLLDSPVRYPYQPRTGPPADPQPFVLGLADGTRVERSYAPDEGLVSQHIAVPPEFGVALASIGT